MGRDENVTVFKDTALQELILEGDSRNSKVFERVLKPYCS